ncbi:MAG: error-prone DNA polymerase, partial [Pyrinomonadaceae bacterium]
PTLERTLGVPLFQDQLLKIAMDIAGFSGSQAEELRRAMGFKRPDKKLESIGENLRAGMTKNGVPPQVQETIVHCVKAFANYGFPESHAYSFALLAYASAYFIVHYRAAFMVAMFNNYPLGFYSAATLVKDAQRHGLHFLALDINRSQYQFTVEEVNGVKNVRVGLKYVKGLRQEIGEEIVTERDGFRLPSLEKDGWTRFADGVVRKPKHYSSVEDLIKRVPSINKREIRALSMAGALNFDNTVHRREALWQSEIAIQPKGDLFDESVSTPNASFLERIEGLDLVEADLKKTGISIGKHPMAFIRQQMERRGILSAQQLLTLSENHIASVAGAVIIRQRPMTAKNVVFITLEDETGHSNFVVMPDIFEKYRSVINQNDYLIIKGLSEERGLIKALHFEPIDGLEAAVVSHNYH